MSNPIQKIILFSTTIAVVGTGTCLKLNRDKSVAFSKNVQNYVSSFKDDDFLVCAHRGYSSKAVENTVDAIELAEKSDYVDYIEIDCRLTSDKKLVLSHDDVISNKVGLSLNIAESNYKNVTNDKLFYDDNDLITFSKSLFSDTEGNLVRKSITRLNHKKYSITPLEDGLDACKDKSVFLDIKYDENTEDMNNSLCNYFKDKDISNITFQSSNLLSLLSFKNMNSDFNCLAIINSEKNLSYIDLFDNVGIRKNLINEEIVDKAINDNKLVSVWTVNSTKELDEVINNTGSHYKDVVYISDYPDMVATYLEKVKKND